MPVTVSAHVVVSPSEVGAGAFQTFTTSVPNEKNVPTTALRLVIPDGLKEVMPTVKPGWKITVKKSGDDVTEIDWKGGSIPVGMRDEFTFSAQAPADATTLQWKVYQTYADKTVVSWDQTPTSGDEDDDSGSSGPYSTTKVINDLSDSASATNSSASGNNQAGAYVLAGVALALAIMALLNQHKKPVKS